MLIILFLVLHFNFLFVPCGRLSWLPVSFLLHFKHTLSYRIVSYLTANISKTVSHSYLKMSITSKHMLHFWVFFSNICHKQEPLMRGTAAFVYSARRSTLTYRKLYWTVQMSITHDGPAAMDAKTRYSLRIASSSCTPAFDAAVNLVCSRLDRGLQSATDMLPLKRGQRCVLLMHLLILCLCSWTG